MARARLNTAPTDEVVDVDVVVVDGDIEEVDEDSRQTFPQKLILWYLLRSNVEKEIANDYAYRPF